MLSTEKNWYEGWETFFSNEYLDTLHIPSVLEIMDYFEVFLKKQSEKTVYEILNAYPGHGKTTALKIFIRKLIENKHSVGGIIVLREKEQMREVEQFVSDEKYGVLYIDSENYQEVQAHIPKYQFIIISHERLKNIALEKKNIKKLHHFTKWKDQQRVIIIDEAPPFVDSSIFELDKSLDWLDDCFLAAKNVFSSEDKIRIRSIIQILMATELIENKGPLTNALKKHLDSQRFAKTLNTFFNDIDYHIDKITSIDSLNMYRWFKKLFNEEKSGYIDSGLYLDNYSDHKKIICSQRIDYRQLNSSILILDGTAVHTKRIYNNEYIITSLSNHTKYERLFISQRSINTSARRRKTKLGLSIQGLIAKDIKKIQSKGINPFPLMNKFEVKEYLNLNVISKQDYERYFVSSLEENVLPINILNTIGKNYLANQKSLYLTSLPNRPAVHYKAIAVSLYKNSEVPLNLSMNQKEKKQEMWFADKRIEEIYQECLLSELFQIIYRSNIRNLLGESYEKVHIFIATNFDHIIDKLLKMLNYQVEFERSPVESMTKFRQVIEKKATFIANKIKKQKINLPKTIGRIEDGSSVKNLINSNWHDEEKKREIIAAFNRSGLDIIEKENNSGRIEKKIDYLKGVPLAT
ncbi:hypothetical protein BAQ48_00085 [Bacillus luti]|uniref:hypothetical protein n=1 Tax=Bacillus luti TaxID=2026191 RepID=UPI0008FDCE03|nr:hypothetical protein [Bacillus luti]OJE52878.1 hypothetical protein BAQ48_00085 [Bacillus luti]